MKNLKLIGKTYNGLDIFKLSDFVAVSAGLEILKIDKNTFFDTDYFVANLHENATMEEIKSKIVNPFQLSVNDNKYMVNAIDNILYYVELNTKETKIIIDNNLHKVKLAKEEKYIFMDIENFDDEELEECYNLLTDREVEFIKSQEVLEFVKYKNYSYIVDEEEAIIYFNKGSKNSKELEAIKNAHQYNVSKYEDFESLDFNTKNED